MHDSGTDGFEWAENRANAGAMSTALALQLATTNRAGGPRSPEEHLRTAQAHLVRARRLLQRQQTGVTARVAKLVTDIELLLPMLSQERTYSKRGDEPLVDQVLEVLTDEGCRHILAETGTRALTVSEIVEQCQLPSSTAYRKIDRLCDADLLDEDVRVGGPGPHASEYRRAVDALEISLVPPTSLRLWEYNYSSLPGQSLTDESASGSGLQTTLPSVTSDDSNSTDSKRPSQSPSQ